VRCRRDSTGRSPQLGRESGVGVGAERAREILYVGDVLQAGVERAAAY
jgi:hypothetical protein